MAADASASLGWFFSAIAIASCRDRRRGCLSIRAVTGEGAGGRDCPNARQAGRHEKSRICLQRVTWGIKAIGWPNSFWVALYQGRTLVVPLCVVANEGFSPCCPGSGRG